MVRKELHVRSTVLTHESTWLTQEAATDFHQATAPARTSANTSSFAVASLTDIDISESTSVILDGDRSKRKAIKSGKSTIEPSDFETNRDIRRQDPTNEATSHLNA